jgi:mevalonate kinase
MTPVTASAPGKLILFGEHAVVYGHPCVVTAVDLRIRARAEVLGDDRVLLRVPGLPEPFATNVEGLRGARRLPPAVRFVALAVRRVWAEAGRAFGVEVATESEFTSSYGLGSSSAATVATVKALSLEAGLRLDARCIFELSREAVLEAQEGWSSGFDVAAATYGGTLYYVAGGEVIAPLGVGVLPLVVGYSGIKADTTECVRRVASRRERFPLLMETILENIAPLAGEAREALEHGDLARAGQLMNLNQGWLQALNVSTFELDSLIEAARAAGAYGAKLSGAGGGDCMIALVEDAARPRVEQAIEGARVPGAKVIRVRTGAEGVRVDG